tara:strand:- start:209 stop:886 length:678 start_codon:yes stop_codon:yes gene_type:complete
MKLVLYNNYYVDRTANRQYEIEQCFIRNIKCSEIDTIVVLMTANHQMHFVQMLLRNDLQSYSKKIKVVHSENRPSYRDWFSMTRKYSDINSISCILNSDIFFTDSEILKIKQYDFLINNCMALSRWDVKDINDLSKSILHERSDSQDCWIKKGSFTDINEANFTLGIAGCDNRIAYLLEQKGYRLINPCYSIKSYHLHNSNVRNYINRSHIERLPPPYSRVIPTA